MARLLLGPLLRHIGAHDATVWVECDAPCEVEVLGHRVRTFAVHGHHYAIVTIEGLEPGAAHPYEVRLDGERVWPEPDSPYPPSIIRALAPDDHITMLFGSCRVAAPHRPPWTLSPDEDERGHGFDSLVAVAGRMAGQPPSEWPHAIFMLGDQVYADEVSPQTLAAIRERRDTSEAPGDEVADFEEYTLLYREAWGDPTVRWLLSTVSSAMLFDDHDVHDDWNISRAWRRRMEAAPWWGERVRGAFMSYWIYQHLGNLSPRELREYDLLREVTAADDAGPLLERFADRANSDGRGERWSFCRDLGRTRLIGVDCRAGRVLEPGSRSMVDEEEWRWLVERCQGDYDHIVIGMSDPFLLPRGAHELEAWSEAVCDGGWGSAAARRVERVREAADLDHWAAFRASFDRLGELLRDVATGRCGEAPSTVVILTGDVHNVSLSRVGFPRGTGAKTRVYQAVCSPLRNPMIRSERIAQQIAATRPAALLGRLLARSAGAPAPSLRWRREGGPWFDNSVGTLVLRGREIDLRIERTVGLTPEDVRLEPLVDRAL
jgi:hypothetical protein